MADENIIASFDGVRFNMGLTFKNEIVLCRKRDQETVVLDGNADITKKFMSRVNDAYSSKDIENLISEWFTGDVNE